MTTTPIAVDPFATFPISGYAAVALRSPRWAGDEVVGYDDEEHIVRVPAGRTPASTIGWSRIYGDAPLAAWLVTRYEFAVANRPAVLATDGGEF